jgi:hypothetical protein
MLDDMDEIAERERQRRKEDEMDNWPIIGSEVPERELGMVESWNLEAAIEHAIDHIRVAIKEMGIRDPLYVDEENGIQFKFLIDTMLRYSRTPEQISNMVNGYIAYCVRECRQHEFRNPMLDRIGSDGFDFRVIDRSCFGPQKMDILEENLGDKKFRTLNKYSRNPAIHTVSQGFAQEPIQRYSRESFYDGAYFIMSDPTDVYHDATFDDELIERRTPEDKRMTKAKLARLLQMPDIEDYIIADREMGGPAIGSNLAIIAEYFCEEENAVYLNSIDPENIEKWLKGKFIQHNPPLEVAFYVWARFQQTEFEAVAEFIEQHILALLKKEDFWIFEATGREMKEYSGPGYVFNLLVTAVENLMDNPDDPNYQRLLRIIPGREIIQIFTKSKNEGYRKEAEYYLKNLKIDSSHVTRDYTDERFRENPGQMMVDVLNEPDYLVEDWKIHEGFELLDPIAIAALDGSIRSWGIDSIRANIFKMLDKLDLSELFIFRNAIVVNVENLRMKAKLEEIITTLIDKAYGEALSEDVNIEVLVDMVRGKEVDPVSAMPAIKSLSPEMRRMPSAGKLPEMAEKSLIVSVFKNARGADEIIKFLMRNRGSMNVVELISPFPDAPNFEIIKRYGESPNLLLFLSMSTILMYLGYSYEDILSIINDLVEKTENEIRPEVGTVGLEWEQVGGEIGNEIATDHFSELFNVLPQGGDAHCNEILSHPSTSADVQNVLMGIITDPQNGYMNTDRMWSVQGEAGVPLSSLHVNVGVPKDLDISSTQIHGYLGPVLRAAAISRGAKASDRYTEFGCARRWAPGSLFDVLGDKNPDVKFELRSTALEEDGSHSDEIRNVVMIASACMQHAKDANGKPVTSSGKVMAEIFTAFAKEAETLKFSVDQAGDASVLLDFYANRVRDELNL